MLLHSRTRFPILLGQVCHSDQILNLNLDTGLSSSPFGVYSIFHIWLSFNRWISFSLLLCRCVVVCCWYASLPQMETLRPHLLSPYVALMATWSPLPQILREKQKGSMVCCCLYTYTSCRHHMSMIEPLCIQEMTSQPSHWSPYQTVAQSGTGTIL